MPWKETCAMEERMKFIIDCQKQEYSKSALCRIYGIGRPTADKWLSRYADAGIDGLADQSRAPKRHPNQVSPEIEEAILAARREHPHWGPKKLHILLKRETPRRSWPAISTIGEILSRHGLTVPRKHRRRTPPYTQPFAACNGPNAVWCGDFKGWFKTGDGSRCDPLTISDAHSRKLLRCQVVKDTGFETTRGLFEATFRQYGLPLAIRTDNGTPFAGRGIGGLSRLSVWWIKLGIVPERIEPGKPQQNGRHERMHGTLKRETARPPARTLRAQQRAFDQFGEEFNHVRPHEALGMATPASVYVYSPRPYPERVSDVTYPDGVEVRRVKPNGVFNWKNRRVFVGEAFGRERVGLEPLDDRYWIVYFGERVLGVFDSHRHLVLSVRQVAHVGVAMAEPSGGPSATLQGLQTVP